MFVMHQRQINLRLFVVLALGITFTAVWFAIVDQQLNGRVIGYTLGAFSVNALAYAYWRGWDPARIVLVILSTLIVGGFIEEPFLTGGFAQEVFIPPVIALIVAGPRVVIGTGIGLLIILGLRGGIETTYIQPDNLVTYLVVLGGMVLSRLASDQAQQLELANARAEEARRQSEQRAHELESRNQELQALVAQIERQNDVIRDLNVPLLPVGESTLVMPLIGALDTMRLQHVQERALSTVYSTSA